MEVVLEFDQNGYVVPYDIVEIKWEILAQAFGHNPHRRKILSAYEDFLITLSKLLPVKHRHWVDGSFVSQKVEPRDIDVIIFVPPTHFTTIISELKYLKNNAAGLVDCYFIESFPADHAKFEISRADELDWYHFLHTDRRKRPKAILELWYDYGNK